MPCHDGRSTLIPTPNFPAGKSSRSLQAAFKLILEGVLPADKVLLLPCGYCHMLLPHPILT